MKVKICGITNIDDAKDAIDAGADALGFVFYKHSPRYIKPKNAKKIIAKLPPFVQYIGLFVNKKAKQINKICQNNNIDIAQIHFDMNKKEFKKLNIKYMKVVRVKNKQDILRYKNQFRLIDAFVDNFGGEGKKIDLKWFRQIDCSKIIIAGGLNPINIAQLKGFGFYGVDVSSGVEKDKKDKKDKKKMMEFVNKAKA